MKSFTGIRDLDREILLRIKSEKDLLNTCRLNKYAYSLCDDTFFMNRILTKYPGAYKYQNKSWKKYYLHILYYIDKLKEYDFYYNNQKSSDPKLYYDILTRKISAENAIEMATRKNLPDLVDYYLRRNEPYDIDFNASLIAAVSVNNLQLIRLFLSYGANFYDGALLEVAKNKNRELVNFFLELGANINDGLCGAVISQDTDWINYFIQKGANDWPYAVICSPDINLANYFIGLSESSALPVNYIRAMNNAARIGNLDLLKYFMERVVKNGEELNSTYLSNLVVEASLISA